MAYAPVAQVASLFEDYPGYFLKGYDQGTTTPQAMATDSSGGTTLAKAEISTGGAVPIGFIKTAGDVIFIPFFTSAYDLFLFPDATTADANDFTDAIQVADNFFLERFVIGVVTDSTDISSMVDNVAALVASSPESGQIIDSKGYYADNDGGQARYLILTSAEFGGTPDEFGDLTLANGNVATLQHDGSIKVEQFGAVGDNATNDFDALSAANKSAATTIIYDRRTYRVEDTLPFPSKKTYTGVFDESAIYSPTNAKPVAASQAWLAAESVSPTGRLTMVGLTFIGEKTNTTQVGFMLHDFYSTMDHVTVLNCGGGGIELTQQKDDATVAAGTLVENKLIYPIIRNCGEILLNLGEDNNNKLTDGYLEGAILDGEGALTVQHLFCGSAAGWQMDGIHCYGSASAITVQLENGNNTRFTDCFIEAFEDRAISATKVQGDIVISGQINADSANTAATAVLASLSGAVTNTSVDVDIAVSLDVATTDIDCFYSDILTGDVRVKARRHGSQLALLNLVGGTNQARIDQVRIMADATVYAQLTDKENLSSETGLEHDVKRLSYGELSGRLSGSGAQTVTVPIKMGSFGKLAGTITIEANSFDNGGNLARYHGMFFVSAKTNGVNAWVATLTTIIAPSGFSAAPAVTATNTAGNDGTIDVTFTFSSANSTGACRVAF